MDNIHISGNPGSGKTSMCLVFSKQVLMNGGRVFWLSSDVNSERFSQIMENVPITKASNFHSLQFAAEASLKDGFEESISQLTRMCKHLPSTKLIVIDGWDGGIDKYSKRLRIENIGELVKLSKSQDFDIYITSQSYENVGAGPEKFIIRSRTKFEELGFQSWLITPHEKIDGLRILIKEENELTFKMSQEGIEYV
jgi:KaiC/GvpD/RAD55 family RecA-like ATPase